MPRRVRPDQQLRRHPHASRRGLPGPAAIAPGAGLERRLIGEAPLTVSGPRVGVGLPVAAVRLPAPSGPRRRLAGTIPAGPGDPVHLRGGAAQGGADVIGLDLVDGALLAFLGLVRPLAEPAGYDHPHPASQGLRDVLRRLPPHVAGQEQAVAVLPLAGGVVAEPRRRGDPEPRHRLTRRGKTQLGVIDKVPYDRDLSVACSHTDTLTPGTDISGACTASGRQAYSRPDGRANCRRQGPGGPSHPEREVLGVPR